MERFTQIQMRAFEKIQINAGVILKKFLQFDENRAIQQPDKAVFDKNIIFINGVKSRKNALTDEITSISDGISESFTPKSEFTANIHGMFENTEIPELSAKINGIFENPEIPELTAKINGIFDNPEVPELSAKINGIVDSSEFPDFSTMVDGVVETPEFANIFYNSGTGAGL